MSLVVVVAVASIPAQATSRLAASIELPACPDPGAPADDPICDPNLRPDTDAWLARIAPIREILIGTRKDDALRAGGEGDVVHGLAGDDELVSTFHRTALIGGRGEDRLETDAFAAGETVDGIAIQLGGDGDDSHRSRLGVSGYESTGTLLLDLGRGDDRAEVELYVELYGEWWDSNDTALGIEIHGDAGDDVVDAVADAQGVYEDAEARNTVFGGDGKDRLSAYAITEFDGYGRILASNSLSGGKGDDVIYATAINWSGEAGPGESASNRIHGGPGEDVIEAFCFTDSNAGGSTGVNEAWGGEGDDELESVHSTDGENEFTELTSALYGGPGNDRLSARSTALGSEVLAAHRLEGGPGDDTLVARLESGAGDYGGYGYDVANHLDGGPGADSLEAWLGADFPETPFSYERTAQNRLAGGSGPDVLLAIVAEGSDAASFVDGGPGRDRLSVVGGSGNVLDGGNGRDDLFAGDGDEQLIGGRGPDVFHFDLAADQGVDTLVDFEAWRDALSFAGLDDAGAPGLIDDLDGVSTVTDLGAGNDLVVDFSIGTRLLFTGLGTGTIVSWAEILPPQSVMWARAGETERVRRSVLSPAALASEHGFARDH